MSRPGFGRSQAKPTPASTAAWISSSVAAVVGIAQSIATMAPTTAGQPQMHLLLLTVHLLFLVATVPPEDPQYTSLSLLCSF